MRKPTSIGVLLVFLFAASSGIIATAGAQDDSGKKDKKEKKKKDNGDAASTPDARPVLWKDPGDIESLDLFAGPGGAGNAPDPNARYTFISRSKSGTSEKVNVEDDKKREWQIKFGAEAKVGPAASRIVWAAGYHVDVDYFVKKSHVEGRGGFDIWDVRFKPKDDYKEDGLWSWHANPFMGTRELDGLKTLMALISNWDLKTDNNKVLRPKAKSGGDRTELIYYVSDLGASFGKTGTYVRGIPGMQNAPAGSKGDAQGYANQVFILGLREDGTVRFNYQGKDHRALYGVRVEHAKWLGNLLGRLSDKQISDAFRAGGFDDADVQTFTRALRSRLDQLKSLK
jgi:hypothetical protein